MELPTGEALVVGNFLPITGRLARMRKRAIRCAWVRSPCVLSRTSSSSVPHRVDDACDTGCRCLAAHSFAGSGDDAAAASRGRRSSRDGRRGWARAAPFRRHRERQSGWGGGPRRREGRGRPSQRAPAHRRVGTERPRPWDRARWSFGAVGVRISRLYCICFTLYTLTVVFTV